MLQLEAHQSIEEHMCKFKGKSIMRQYMKNKPIRWGFKFWFRCGAKSDYLYEFDRYLGRKGNAEFGLGESVILSLCQKLKDTHCFVFFDKSSTIGQAFRNGDLCNRYCDIQPKEYASFEAWQGDERQRA